MSVTVRTATHHDRDTIWSMLEPVFQAGETYAIDRNISREDALSYWLAANSYVAEEGGQVLGTFYIRRNQPGGGAHVCNCGYVTARGAEGKGVARSMLAFSLDEARRLGFEAMQFNFVLEENARAVAMWQRNGFDIIGRIPRAFYLPDGRISDAFIMHRYL